MGEEVNYCMYLKENMPVKSVLVVVLVSLASQLVWQKESSMENMKVHSSFSLKSLNKYKNTKLVQAFIN